VASKILIRCESEDGQEYGDVTDWALLRNEGGKLRIETTCGHCGESSSLTEKEGLLDMVKEISSQLTVRAKKGDVA
jgi:hypothetical protein